jgi:hypothetical protein
MNRPSLAYGNFFLLSRAPAPAASPGEGGRRPQGPPGFDRTPPRCAMKAKGLGRVGDREGP